eukprot:403362643
MLKEVLSGRSHIAAKSRIDHADIDRKFQLRLLTSKKTDEVDFEEVFTTESLIFGMDMFNDIRNINDFDEQDSSVVDYSLYAHNRLAPNLKHCKFQWQAEHFKVLEEKHFKNLALTSNQPELRKMPDNTQNFNVRCVSRGFDLKKAYFENLSQGDLQDVVADIILTQIEFGIEQSNAKNLVLNPNISCIDVDQTLQDSNLLEEEVLSTRKELWYPYILGEFPKDIINRIVDEQYLDKMRVIESNYLQFAPKEKSGDPGQVQSQELYLNAQDEIAHRSIHFEEKFEGQSHCCSTKDFVLKKTVEDQREDLFSFCNKRFDSLSSHNTMFEVDCQDFEIGQFVETKKTKLPDQVPPLQDILNVQTPMPTTQHMFINKTVISINPSSLPNSKLNIETLAPSSTRNIHTRNMTVLSLQGQKENSTLKQVQQTPRLDSHRSNVSLKVKKSQSPVQRDLLSNTQRLHRIINQTLSLRKIRELAQGQDKSLNSLIMFQFNFRDLKKTIDFLLNNQKKHAFLIQQMINTHKSSKISGDTSKSKDSDNAQQMPNMDFLDKILEKKKEEQQNKVDLDQDKGHGNMSQNNEEIEKMIQEIQLQQKKDQENITANTSIIEQLQNSLEKLNQKFGDMELRTDIHESKIFDLQTELENMKLIGELEQVKKQRTINMNRQKTKKVGELDDSNLEDEEDDDDEIQEPQIDQEEVDFQSQIDELKKMIQDLSVTTIRPTATIRASAMMDQNGGVASKDIDELRERMTISEIKVNDVEQRLSLLLRAKKAGRARANSGAGNNEEESQAQSGLDIGEIISLLDQVKQDLRSELSSKFDHENLERRVTKLEQDANILFEELDKSKLNIQLNVEKLDGHQNRLNSDSDLITELQNQLRRLTDQVKQKVDGEEIDSMTLLVNDMFERFKEIESSGMFSQINNGNSSNSLNPANLEQRKSIAPLERRVSNVGTSSKDSKIIRELAEQVQQMKEKLDKLQNEVINFSEIKIKITELFGLVEKKANLSEFTKIQQIVDTCNYEMNKQKSEFEFLRQGQSQFKYGLDDIQDQLRTEVQRINQRMEEIHEKLDELYKVHNEKKAILNIPVNFESKSKGKDGKGGGGFDTSLVVDALEKMRDYIAIENKKMREDFFKLHLDIEAKMKSKLDRTDIEELEKRILENVDLQINEKTKRYVDKADLKKIKAQIDKQIENLFALIQARLSAQVDGDNAMLAKKPLGGWSCASCEKNITNLSQQVNEHHHWNRLPFRDPSERMAKVGQGFSKMLQMIKPMDIGHSRLTIDDTNLSILSPLQNYQSVPDLKTTTTTAQQNRLKNLSPQIGVKQGHSQIKKMASTQITFQNQFNNGNDSIDNDQPPLSGHSGHQMLQNKSQTQLLPKIGYKTAKQKKIQ